jgi:hypothetical protein
LSKFPFTLIIRSICVLGILFIISLFTISDNLGYAHVFSGTPNFIFKEKDGYRIGFLSYLAIPKVNDNNTLLNFNVQKNGSDVTNTFISLIIKDNKSDRIVHQVPYKFYEFADSSYSYIFQDLSKIFFVTTN